MFLNTTLQVISTLTKRNGCKGNPEVPRLQASGESVHAVLPMRVQQRPLLLFEWKMKWKTHDHCCLSE